MKVTELLEALAPNAPSAADIEFSIAKIDEVIDKIKEEKNDPQYKRKYDQSKMDMAIKKMELAKEIHGGLDKFNSIKKDIDESYKAKDVEKFEKANTELRAFLREFGLTKKLMDAKRGTRGISGWPTSKAYELKMHKMLDTMAQVRDTVEWHLKRMKMTDGQKSAADKASANMRARWGSY